jgi:ATP-binding cassette subfamily G (WHITE) protein 2 (PDR)
MAQPPAPWGAPAASALIGTEIQRVLSERSESQDVRETPSAGESTEKNSFDDMSRKERDEITHLARQISQLSRRSSNHPGPGQGAAAEEPPNPFLNPDADPELNPNSDHFNQRKWVKNLLQIVSRDPQRYPRRTAGVSFRNLNAYGYGTAADYQMNVANAWLKGFGWFKSVLGFGKKVRIDILRDFEGLVRSGEMLVVLGRPGRCV